MYTEQELIYLKVITPLHAGAGQGLEIVDMPIQREKHSNIPKIEGSTLKGSLKHFLYHNLEDKDKEELYRVFGPENGDDYASAISFTDARLLFFPVRSVTNIFQLITCPYIIKRWVEDLQIIGREKTYDRLTNLQVEDGDCLAIHLKQKKVILEEYVFNNKFKLNNYKEEFNGLFDKIEGLKREKIIILSDSDFIDFVTMYTEIITRNKISIETGAAEETGLFTEEYLPAESILYFIVLGSPTFPEENKKKAIEVINYFNKNVNGIFQVGGNATIGKGFVKRIGSDQNDKSKKC